VLSYHESYVSCINPRDAQILHAEVTFFRPLIGTILVYGRTL